MTSAGWRKRIASGVTRRTRSAAVNDSTRLMSGEANAHARVESEREIGGKAAEECPARNRAPAMTRIHQEHTSEQPARRPHRAHARRHIEREPEPAHGEIAHGSAERNGDVSYEALAESGDQSPSAPRWSNRGTRPRRRISQTIRDTRETQPANLAGFPTLRQDPRHRRDLKLELELRVRLEAARRGSRPHRSQPQRSMVLRRARAQRRFFSTLKTVG